jgi:hypothetical protein
MSTCKDCVAGLLSICREEYCYAERVALVERATRAAERLGHQLTEFAKIKKQPAWRARCTRCGLQVTITIDPELGQTPISGEAVSADCPGPERAQS